MVMRHCRHDDCAFAAEHIWQISEHARKVHPRPTKGKPIDKTSYERGKRLRAQFLMLIQEGTSVKDAKVKVGWLGANSYSYHRREYPHWAQAVDLARASLRQKPEPRKLQAGSTPAKVGEPIEGISTLEESVDAFRDFTREYFPDRRPHQPQQLRIVAELNNLRPREVCLFLVHPEAGKTATFEDYICRTLALDPNHRFRIISEGADLSKRIVGTCARRFTDDSYYKKFIKTYGPFYEKGQERRGKPWTTDQITILGNSGEERDRSLVANSWSGANYGSRIDTLIIDDIQSQRNYNQAEEIFRRVRGTFFNRGLGMRTLIVGTRIAAGDFYDRMLDAGLITKKVILAAADQDGNPTVPQFWDDGMHMIHDGGPCCAGFRTCPRNKQQLTAREKMEQVRHQSGEETWWAAYQQQPSSDERSTFGQWLDGCLDRDRVLGQLPRSA